MFKNKITQSSIAHRYKLNESKTFDRKKCLLILEIL